MIVSHDNVCGWVSTHSTIESQFTTGLSYKLGRILAVKTTIGWNSVWCFGARHRDGISEAVFQAHLAKAISRAQKFGYYCFGCWRVDEKFQVNSVIPKWSVWWLSVSDPRTGELHGFTLGFFTLIGNEWNDAMWSTTVHYSIDRFHLWEIKPAAFLPTAALQLPNDDVAPVAVMGTCEALAARHHSCNSWHPAVRLKPVCFASLLTDWQCWADRSARGARRRSLPIQHPTRFHTKNMKRSWPLRANRKNWLLSIHLHGINYSHFWAPLVFNCQYTVVGFVLPIYIICYSVGQKHAMRNRSWKLSLT